MKTVKSLLLTVLIGASVVACKKGEDDPFLSLRTRDARLAGEWSLKEYSSKYISIRIAAGQADTLRYESYDFNGANLVYYLVDTAVTATEANAYSRDLTIEKDGSYTKYTTIDSDEYEETGVWYWTNDGKNKSGMAFDNSDNAYDILELRNKKFVLTQDSKSIHTDSLGAETTTTFTEKRIYEAK